MKPENPKPKNANFEENGESDSDIDLVICFKVQAHSDGLRKMQ